MLAKWWAALLDLLYPPRCPGCRRPVAGHGAWCQRCLTVTIAERGLNTAGRHLAALAACRVLCDYSGGLKTVIHRLKFQRQESQAAYLTWLLTAKLAHGTFTGIDAVVPVPLHAGRLADRGFNQTELIFHPWTEAAGWTWLDVLTRSRPTRPQWELPLAERRKNIKGAFTLTRPELVRGKTILLVDDIVTTGLTLNECARQLKRGGATKVIGLALAGGGD